MAVRVEAVVLLKTVPALQQLTTSES